MELPDVFTLVLRTSQDFRYDSFLSLILAQCDAGSGP